ncbi:MAG: hypothetical protein HY278_08305 [candidate division NC10 bacterium]|nr:hypothetical protein [candidate division NC10 bacterium]
MRSYSRPFWFCLPAVAILLTSCAAGRVGGGTYVNETKGFAVQLPSEVWDREIGSEPDLLLRHRSRYAGMLVHATCDQTLLHRPLEIAARHLFFGIKEREILRHDRRTDNQGEAVEMVLKGELGGQKLLLHGYTLKGPGCVYDLVLFASPEAYAEANREFESLVRQFRLVQEEKR